MRIAIVATPISGGGLIKAKAYKAFLESKNHKVDLIKINDGKFSEIAFFYHRVMCYLNGKEPSLMKEISKRIEKKIINGKYEALIGVESLFSYVLTKNLNCLKIFSWESVGADEVYFNPNLKQSAKQNLVKRYREMELEICRHSDYVIFPWETTESYVRKNIYDGANFLTVRHGCHPQSKTVSYSFPISIVSVGGLGAYWSNIDLLSNLTVNSSHAIDVYGLSKPSGKYKINYKGFAPSLDVLYSYQFGLNTLSKDLFRQNHFSSRVLSYLAYGLPVLSPDWMKFSNKLKGCLPYNESNFNDLVDKYSNEDDWQKLSIDAIEQAKELDWQITLKPLEKILVKA